MDHYSSPYIIPYNSPHNPIPPFPTKNQTVRATSVQGVGLRVLGCVEGAVGV